MSQHTTAKLLSNGIVIAGLENVLQVEMFDTSYYENRSFAQIVSSYSNSSGQFHSVRNWHILHAYKPSQSLTKIIKRNTKIYDIK